MLSHAVMSVVQVFSSFVMLSLASVFVRDGVTPGFKAKPDAHRMYAQDQVVIHTVRM
jgi:hypothetical protein